MLTPPWWRQRPRLKLSVRPEREWGEGSGLFGVDGLCAYEWRVAVGDALLTLSELEALAELKLPLVKARGRWIALRTEDVEMALRFFRARRAAGRASAAELLRDGLAVKGGQEDELPEVEIEAAGWLGELLVANGDRRLADVPTPSAFVGELRPYQRRGLAWLSFMSSLGLGACLADDMGLGKTPQTLALLLAEREASATGKPPALRSQAQAARADAAHLSRLGRRELAARGGSDSHQASTYMSTTGASGSRGSRSCTRPRAATW